MTRPEQPQPYPGDPGYVPPGDVVTERPTQPRPYPGDSGSSGGMNVDFRDPSGRPLSGDVYIRNAYDELVPATITNGHLNVQAPPGVYTLVAVLRDSEGRVYYRNGRFTL
jgi:hypothetical protein